MASTHHAPPPSTPYLTEKILTLASSSDRRERDDGGRQRGPLPPPASPTDSVAQAMKNDLEELIGYIDNLAFEKEHEKAVPKGAGTPSTNKQLFPGDDHPSNASYDDHTINRNNVLRDRTNRFVKNVEKNNLREKLRDGEIDPALTKAKLLEPLGNPPRREEPAGSPPSQEASLYFHDESLSLNLSQSQEIDESNFTDRQLNAEPPMVGQDDDKSGRPPRLLSTLQNRGLILSPEKSKKISFVSVSKDPTPSKAIRSTFSNFDPNDKEESELHSTPALRRNLLGDRKATPFPRNKDRFLDRLEQENVDRKGNEWWRARPNSNDSLTQRDTSIRFESQESVSLNENAHGKSLKWEENYTSPMRGPQYIPRGTPHPSSRIDHRNVEIDEPVLETPVPHQGKKSNLVLTSPESAKKLLQSAMEALQDARKERDEARQWATDMKESVNEWVEDQRRLIRTESASISCSNNPVSSAFVEHKHQAIEDSINHLRSEIKTSKSHTESQLHSMMLKQDEQIRELSRQLAIVKEQLSHVMSEDTSKKSGSYKVRGTQPNKVEESNRPGFSHKTPINEKMGLARSASRSETSNASSRGSHRIRRSTPSGGHLIDYGNGVTKELHPDGTTVTKFKNGDIETRFAPNTSTASSPSASCTVAYYHCKEEVLQITQRDGSVLYEYANGQVERHCADGVKIVLFPDGTKTIV